MHDQNKHQEDTEEGESCPSQGSPKYNDIEVKTQITIPRSSLTLLYVSMLL